MTTLIEQRSEAWFEQRKKRVTASLVGAILGHSPYLTRAQAMRSLVRDAIGAPREFEGNPATAWGTANEKNALLDFQLEVGLSVSPAPFVPFEDWAGASPDGYVSDGALLEIKAPYGLRKDEQPDFKPIAEQPHYYDQVQFQLICTDRQACHFWQWSPYGHKHEIVLRDATWAAINMPILRQFYAEFLDELANNADDYLAPPRVEIDTPAAYKMVHEWDEIAEQLAQLEERKKDLLRQMVEACGGKNADFAGRKLSLVKKAGSISYAKAIKQLCPQADLEPYRGKPTEYWTMR